MRDYNFGNFLHELRKRRGLTQYQLGVLVGVSDKAVSKWENGSSKPQSNILYKLSEVLEISVDELLICKYHFPEKKEVKGAFVTKKQLWDKTFDAMYERYGNSPPVKILNRLLSEQTEMQNTDMIVYFDMLSKIAYEAKKQGEHIRVLSGTGAFLVSYLRNATEINPLEPHYYCPECKTVIFDTGVGDGWDLPRKKCSCGKEMQRDGHNIPFETHRHLLQRRSGYFVSMSPNFLRSAKSLIEDYFKDCDRTVSEREENRVITYTISSDTSVCTFTFLIHTEFELYQALERATAKVFDRVDFCQNQVLAEFQKGNTDGISEFCTKFCKDMIEQVSPVSFRDLIQIAGLCHGTGVWFDNAKDLIDQKIPVSDVIAYREDVFNYIQKHMLQKGITNTGYAYTIMENVRRGVYEKNGISDEMRKQFKDIEMEDWFIDSIGKIKILFQKAHGVTLVKLAATLMWYKIHYPKEFREIML